MAELETAITEFEGVAKRLNASISGNLIAENPAEVPSIGGANSSTDAIIRLFESDWGMKPRTIREIMDALNANGTYLPMTTLSSLLFNVVRKGRLKRWKADKNFVYHRGRSL